MLYKKTILGLVVALMAALVLSACSVQIQLPNQTIQFGKPVASATPLAAVPTTPEAILAPAPTATLSAQTGTQSYLDEEKAFMQVYELASPSVVQIVVNLPAQSAAQNGLQPQIPNNPRTPQGTPQAPTGQDQAVGSGFIYDTLGHIITNNHVVDGATRIVVTFSDGSQAAGTLIGNDPASDLAVIQVKVDASLLKPITLGDSDKLKVGQLVAAIGDPFGLQGSMSTGIVSGLGRLLALDQTTGNAGHFSIPDMVQTDAAINPGNSGGPLLNLAGEVIGVNTAIESPVRANSGVGYAVPSSIVRQVVPDLIKNGRTQHPWLGLSGGTLNADLARAMNLDPNTRGVLISSVVDNAPAAKAGLRSSSTPATIDGLQTQVGGDIITAIENKPVKVFDDLLTYLIRYTHSGQIVTLDILRDGKPMQVKVTLEPRPTQ